MNDLGYITAKEFQLKALSRIVGGHSIIGIAPTGAGKTTTYVLGVLMRLKYTMDEAPKVLILASDEGRVFEIVDRFLTISQNKSLHIMALDAGRDMEEEIIDLVRGVDIVVATPARARAVYLKLGLNLNRIQTFIIDDADALVKQGMQTRVRELAQSCGKVQYLAFSTVLDHKIHLMIDDFMPFATLVEVKELTEKSLDTHELIRYNVPDFTTKIKLLRALLEDKEVFDQVVIFVNSPTTTHTLSESLPPEEVQIASKSSPASRILIHANEDHDEPDLSGIPFRFYLELPTNMDDFVRNALKNSEDEVIVITLVTDEELPQLKKIEEALGKEIPVMPLPDEL